AKGFCHGERGVARTSARPMAFTRCRKLSAEDAVAIADEKPGRRVVGEGLDNLLRRPSRGRGIGHVEMYDSAAVMEEDYEHVEHAERRRGHDEEVDRDKIGDVISRKVRQVCSAPACP